MFFFSAIVAVVLDRDWMAFYFRESYMFYNIMMVLVMIFALGFFFVGKNSSD
jgi:hypothetical protein